MKIAMLMRDSPDTTFAGLPTYCREVSKALRARGHEIEWFIGGTDRNTLGLGGRIPDRFDLVYAVSLPYGARVKLPLVAKVNSPLKQEGKWYPGLKRLAGFIGQFYEVAVLNKALKVISVSQTSHDILKNEYWAESTVIPDGVDSEAFKPDKLDGDHTPTICATLREEPRKNPKETRAMIDYAGDRARYFINDGTVMPDFMRQQLSRADIFITASKSEAFNISLLEAMASGCACLASDIPAHRELVREGVDGYLFDGDADMKDKLDLLLGSKELRAMMGGFAREKAFGYSWERCAEATEKVFKEALT